MKIKWYKWINVLFTKKRLNKSKKSQYLFNLMFKPHTSKEVKKNLKQWKKDYLTGRNEVLK